MTSGKSAKRRTYRSKKTARPIEAQCPESGSFGEWLSYFTPPSHGWIPYWPADAFAIAAAFMRRTGMYAQHDAHLSLERRYQINGQQVRQPVDVGDSWRRLHNEDLKKGTFNSAPTEVLEWWQEFTALSAEEFSVAAVTQSVQLAAWCMFIAADVACQGVGTTTSDLFLGVAHRILHQKNGGRSLCFDIVPEKLAVLAKQHTPDRGCTLRSLSHNLALYAPTEIKAYWRGPFARTASRLDVVNLLLLPWPDRVSAGDFRIVESVSPYPKHRYFEFEPRSNVHSPSALAKRVANAIAKARAHAGEVHGIVFPEGALTESQFKAIERVAIDNEAMLIAGVRFPGNSSNKGFNLSCLQHVGLTGAAKETLKEGDSSIKRTRYSQFKHHRWCLDSSQIVQYGLGGRLPASHDCWERIELAEREINFVALKEWLTVCTLICEDLARQDPVAEVIRSVGPNLVVALLMDGPQLNFRWPARYASVLAEDPGSSVLTITSLGMSRMSKSPEQLRRRKDQDKTPPDNSRVIAFWRDRIKGEFEIELEADDHDACVLSLVCESKSEWTLDGREDRAAYFPVFAGVYSFCTNPKKGPKRA
jgi:hypothetical protein